MNIIIYNPNSFGGNYNYANRILEEYLMQGRSCKLILPSNASKSRKNHRAFILLSDVPKTQYKLLKKLYFVFRSILNPFLFFFYLLFKRSSVVIFNDFDQLTAFLWVPFFFILKLKHRFAVVLHDPDRDAYFPNKWLSGASMCWIMVLMDWGIYHEVLPQKWYYNNKVQYFSVPHGLYDATQEEDPELNLQLKALKRNYTNCAIIGNIREEKNYEAAIAALKMCDTVHLIIAGKAAHSGYTEAHLQAYAKQHGVLEKITWLTKYLSDEELNSVLKHTDVLLLNYASSFKSQSGVLNLAATFTPSLLVSKTDSALYHSCKTFNLAEFIMADSPEALQEKFIDWDKNGVSFEADWYTYKAYASWDQNIKIALKHFNYR